MRTILDKLPTHPFLVVQEGEKFNIMNTETGLYRFERGQGCATRESAHTTAETWAFRHLTEPHVTARFFIFK